MDTSDPRTVRFASDGEDFPPHFSERLKRRQEPDLTQEQLSHCVGRSVFAVRKMESG